MAYRQITDSEYRDWAGSDERDELMRDSIAHALESVARQLRAGIEPENMRMWDTESMERVYAFRTSFSDAYRAVHMELRDMLCQQRDFGSPEDRKRNRQGKYLQEHQETPFGPARCGISDRSISECKPPIEVGNRCGICGKEV